MMTSDQSFISSPANQHKVQQYEIPPSSIKEIERMIFHLYTDEFYPTTSSKMQLLIRSYMTLMKRQQMDLVASSSNNNDETCSTKADHSIEQRDRFEYWLSQLLLEMLQIAMKEQVDVGNYKGKDGEDARISVPPLRRDSLIIHIANFQSLLSSSTNHLLDLALKRITRSYELKSRLCNQPLAPMVKYMRWQMLMSREEMQISSTQRVLLVQLWLDYIEKHPQLLQMWLYH